MIIARVVRLSAVLLGAVALPAVAAYAMPSEPPESYYVVCGKGTGCPEGEVDVADASELHEVRCCKDEYASGFETNRCDNVWAASDLGGCHTKKTYSEAEAICGDYEGRLCTKDEVSDQCTKGSGCGVDNMLIWSSTPAPIDDAEYYVVCGKGTGCPEGNEDAAPVSELHEVRCCKDEYASGFETNRCDNVWAASDLGGCHVGKNYFEAEAICGDYASRLCTKDEISDKCTKGSGCGIDNMLIWSSTPITVGTVSPAPSSASPTVSPVATPEPPPPPAVPEFKSAAPLYNQYDVCTDFCKGALTTCEGVVDWVTNTYAQPFSRHIDSGRAGTEATGKPWEQFGACHDTCMGWVYWRQDARPDFSQRFFNGYATGDSLNCRYNHLMFASGVPNFPYGIAASESESAPQHCQHITDDGGWVCTDYRNSDNKTPSQLYKESSFTKHRVGDCWLAADNKIADCHRKALNDANVDQQLLWVPDDVEYIFLHVNSLTKVPDLSRFTELKGIYLENNALTVLESDDFASNTKLEVLGLANNFITEIPADLFASNTNLKAFYFHFNYITAVPATLFRTCTGIEMISFVDNKLTGFEPGTFSGLGSLKLLAFGQQGKAAENGNIFTADGIPDGLFDDLVSLEYLSTFINGVAVLKESWFGDWSANLESFITFLYQTGPVPPLVIEDGVFDKLPSLIDFASYSSGNIMNPDDVKNNTNLLTVLYGSQFDILAPLPEPDLLNAGLASTSNSHRSLYDTSTSSPVATPEPPPPPAVPEFKSAAPLYNQYDVCTDFCKGALTTCEGVVDWVTNTYAQPFSRHIDSGRAGTEATGKPWEQFGACHDTCMGWVYWRQDARPDFSQRFFNGYATGDSLNCRYNHLMFASGVPNFPYGIAASESESAPQHCQHITDDGGWVCTDYRNSDNKTPSQLYKESSFTKHRVGDCWLAADNKIADCHRKALNDANVDQQLLWVPDDVEYIFLHVNSLTKVPDLSRFTELKGIYLENNALTVLESDDFASNTKLEVLGLANNFITEIPADLFASVTNLKAFFFHFNYITAVPATLFRTCTGIEIIGLVDNKLTGFEPGTFSGLGSLKLLAFGQQGKAAENGNIFTADGIPDGLFDDLVSLEYLSTFINGVAVLKESWFGDWSANLESFITFLYQTGPVPPLVVEDGVFDKLPSLIDFASYSSGNIVNPDDVKNNTNLLTVLYGSQFDILAPLPEPDILNAGLI